jgi:hypothetical protein
MNPNTIKKEVKRDPKISTLNLDKLVYSGTLYIKRPTSSFMGMEWAPLHYELNRKVMARKGWQLELSTLAAFQKYGEKHMKV